MTSFPGTVRSTPAQTAGGSEGAKLSRKGYDHLANFTFVPHSILLLRHFSHILDAEEVDQAVDFILSLEQAFLHLKREQVVLFHLPYTASTTPRIL